MTETKARIGIGEFVRNAIRLPNDQFEEAMRLDNNDKNIDDVVTGKGAAAWTEEELEAYEKL